MRRCSAGDTIGGKYRLVSILGEGGMSTVWRADHMTLRCPIALKLIDPVVALDPVALQRFLREARTAAALRSPHVVQILDYGVDGDTPYIAMEMLEGESLAQRRLRAGRLSPRETARVVRHVARALRRAHEAGIVHRDLKPENIFVVENEDEAVIKVLDFGIAKAKPRGFEPRAASVATRAGALMGTPSFMSPEQVEARATVDFRADLWALGVVAFECLLGELPFKGDGVARLILAICNDPMPIPSRVGAVPHGFDAWFARACARDPLARFASAMDAADEFDQVDNSALKEPPSSRSRDELTRGKQSGARLEASTALSCPAGVAGPRAASPRRHRSAAIAAIAGAVVVAGALGSGKLSREPAADRLASALGSEPQPLAQLPVSRAAALGQQDVIATVAHSLQSDALASSHAAPVSYSAAPPAPAQATSAPTPIARAEPTPIRLDDAGKPRRKRTKPRNVSAGEGAPQVRPTKLKMPIDLGI